MNCIIVEDEPLAAQLLEAHVHRYPKLKLVATCVNTLEAFAILQQQQVDLMFLDIRLPGMDGINFLKALKNPPVTVLVTAYDQYAVAGFELAVADYLLKPVIYDRFEICVDRIFQKERVTKTAAPDFTYFKVSRDLVRIEHKDILLAQALKDYILLKTKAGNYTVYMTMKYLAGLLPTPPFLRTHRSFIINKEKVEKLERNSVWINGWEVPVSDSYRAGLAAALKG